MNFTANLDGAGNTTMLFFIGEAKKCKSCNCKCVID